MPRPTSRDLFVGPLLRVGRFDCEPGHPLWRTDNENGPWPVLAFPGTPVEIAQEGRRPLVATANQVVLYNPGQRYRRRLVDRTGDHCVYISAAPAVVRELLADVDAAAADRDDPFVGDHGPADPRAAVEPFLLARHLQTAGDERDPLLVEERALYLLSAVLRGLRPPATATHAHQELARAIAGALAASFCEPRSLAELAAGVGCSPFHAARVFHATTGRTIHAYRHNLRLHAVLHRLDDAAADLTELALATGFSSHSHLTAAFRRAFGAPPSRWRGRLGPAQLRALADLLWRGRARI